VYCPIKDPVYDPLSTASGGDDCMDAVGRAMHDHREVGGRVTAGTVTEEAKAEGMGEGVW
jgi:hypothetical protein